MLLEIIERKKNHLLYPSGSLEADIISTRKQVTFVVLWTFWRELHQLAVEISFKVFAYDSQILKMWPLKKSQSPTQLQPFQKKKKKKKLSSYFYNQSQKITIIQHRIVTNDQNS